MHVTQVDAFADSLTKKDKDYFESYQPQRTVLTAIETALLTAPQYPSMNLSIGVGYNPKQ